MVITDIANYYDTISYTNLRNVIAGITDVEEATDMLIYILSHLLWQPDYTPRVEVGLPQINLDAPRLLRNRFLYELDEFLDFVQNCDFVRYMDDIDVGVDLIVDAKNMLKSIDLSIRHIRLNSGKTQILRTREGRLTTFSRVLENAQIDRS